MADIRIKDLTTTASSTASDDFIAVDGTTNGTRKLNAFSPTFGGNATVTGTLTAASNFSIASTGFYAGGGTPGAGRFLYSATAGSMLCGQGGSTYDLSLASSTGTTILGVPTGTNNVLIPATTASTTTSSGALVVGNGTSGGLGVGGNITLGGGVNIAGAASDPLPAGTSGIWTLSGSGLRINSAGVTFASLTGTTLGTATVTVNGTTSSTSTSSGALVVSGGVGVAKRIHSGEGLTTGGDNETHISFVRNGTVSIGPTSAAAPKLSISSGVVLAAATQNLAAWGDVGAQFAVSGSVLTDTQSSGTVSRCVLNSFASTNVAAAGTTTFTQAATLFVAGAPTAGTNVTITNAYAIYTAAGRINFQGLPTSSAGLQAGTLWNDGGTLKVA